MAKAKRVRKFPVSKSPPVKPLIEKIQICSIFAWLVGCRWVGWSVVRNAWLTPGPLWFSSNVPSQYTSDPQDFLRSLKPSKISTRGADQKFPPNPPNPPNGEGGGSIIYGLIMKDHSDYQRTKYFWEAPDLKHFLSYIWGVPRPPRHLGALRGHK